MSDLSINKKPPIRFVVGETHKELTRSMLLLSSKSIPEKEKLSNYINTDDLNGAGNVKTRIRSSSMGDANNNNNNSNIKRVKPLSTAPPLPRRSSAEEKVSPRPAVVERFIKILEILPEEQVVVRTFIPQQKTTVATKINNINNNNSSSTQGTTRALHSEVSAEKLPLSLAHASVARKPLPMIPKKASPTAQVRLREKVIKPSKPAVALPSIVPAVHSNSLVDKLVSELVESEYKYLQDLEVIQFTREGLIQTVSELSSTMVEEIFRNVDEIAALTRGIYEQLQRKQITHTQVFKVFIDVLPAFVGAYTTYCSRQQQASAVIKALSQQKKDFKAFLKKLNTKLSLEVYIIKPIQHVCKYLTLMKEIRTVLGSSRIPQKEAVRENMDTVIHNLEVLTKQVDERQYENLMDQRYILLQQELENAGSNLLLISPSRRLIRNGPMVGQEQKQKAKAPLYDGYYYLFSDVFVFARKKKKGGLKVVALIELLGAVISECISLPGEYSFLFLCNKGKWRFSMHTYEEKLIVMEEVREAIERVNWEDDMDRSRTGPVLPMARQNTKKRISL